LQELGGIAADLAGQSVLVTGAGGYIGSALVKTIAAAAPGRIVLLDSCEQNLFEIARHLETGRDLETGWPIRHEAILGTVTDALLLDDLFDRFRLRFVYHAAAFKHVPLLEQNPFAAIHNNAIGTYTLAQAVLRHGPARLTLVSTDKAVNPHSIMGASKRIAELTVVSLASAQCPMNAVRLGNVIGSTGSVVPIFQRQIAAREPVTVTDREATRYFMSLDEAVEAILACGSADCSGRILLPDLGAPVRIEELARSLILAAGDGELPIRFTGLRQGDKLVEDLLLADEVKVGTSGKLSIVRTPTLTAAQMDALMERLCSARKLDALLAAVNALVPEYSCQVCR
jgi:FlaA1/EpsC-like NDP-sugar epimerase